MRILVVNDDSVSATQLIPLVKWCQKLGQVTVCVPEFEQSGKSHGIELHKPFRAKKRELVPGVTCWVVDSAPADCVRFAVLGQKMEFDLVISGINRGYNMGTDILYSGTVAGLSEAGILNIPAIALSTSYDVEIYEQSVQYLDMVWEYIQERKLLDKHSLYNINIPPKPQGFKITCQGGPYYSDDFDHQGDDLYMPRGLLVYENRNDLTLDTDAVHAGYVSVMPVTVKKTDMEIYRLLTQEQPE